MNPLDEAVSRHIEALRDARRPTLELVLSVVEDSFENVYPMGRRVLDGSDGSNTWMWEDTAIDPALQKFYILTVSTAPGTEGYPMMTIRQAFSHKLDTWVTMSSILPGPDRDDVAHSLALLIAQHACAFAGMKYGSSVAAANKGHPHAAVMAAAQLLQAKPMVIDGLDELVADGDPPASGDKEMN